MSPNPIPQPAGHSRDDQARWVKEKMLRLRTGGRLGEGWQNEWDKLLVTPEILVESKPNGHGSGENPCSVVRVASKPPGSQTYQCTSAQGGGGGAAGGKPDPEIKLPWKKVEKRKDSPLPIPTPAKMSIWLASQAWATCTHWAVVGTSGNSASNSIHELPTDPRCPKEIQLLNNEGPNYPKESGVFHLDFASATQDLTISSSLSSLPPHRLAAGLAEGQAGSYILTAL